MFKMVQIGYFIFLLRLCYVAICNMMNLSLIGVTAVWSLQNGVLPLINKNLPCLGLLYKWHMLIYDPGKSGRVHAITVWLWYSTREGRVLEIQEWKIATAKPIKKCLCALCEKQSEAKVHAETAKGKTRRDRRESRFQMSLRTLRANQFLPKHGDIQCIREYVASRPSLGALREKIHLVHADTTKGGSEKGK